MNWGAMTTGRNTIHMPASYDDATAAFMFAHEGKHAAGGDELAAYTSETEVAMDCDLKKFIRPGFVVKGKDGKEVIDTEAIKKFIEESYKGWYEASKTKEYRRKQNGTIDIDYGKETPETGKWACP